MVQVSIDGVVHAQKIELNLGAGKSTWSSNLQKAKDTINEPGTALIEDIAEGSVDVEIEQIPGAEQDIASLKKKLQRKLDGSYRELVMDMNPFQQQWNEYGYGSLVFNGAEGLWDGSSAWLEDQAELFDADMWKSFGNSVSEGLSEALDFTADLIPDVYEKIDESIEDTKQWLNDNSDNITTVKWWNSQIKDGVDKTVSKVKGEINEAANFIESSSEKVKNIIKYKDDILNLPKQICRGDAISVQRFVDTALMHIDEELAKEIKNSPNFHITLELIADNDAALTYFAYLDLFIEAVPPNFYAYTGAKGGAYVFIEVILLIVLSFITAGIAAGARLTVLAARFTVVGAKTAKVLDKADKAQLAFKAMLDDFEKCAGILKDLGEKLVQSRSANRLAYGSTKSTVVLKKKMIKRESGCMNCQSKDHSTPRELNGCVVYE